MRPKIDSYMLEDLDAEVANMKRVLDESTDTDELIRAAKSLMEEANLLLECVSDDTGWERPHTKDEEEDDDEPER